MNFYKQDHIEQLDQETINYVKKGVNHILEEKNLPSTYFEPLFKIWIELEYRANWIQNQKVNVYIKNNYTKEKSKKEIKEEYNNKHVIMVAGEKRETLSANAKKMGLNCGRLILQKSFDILHEFYVVERVAGNIALDTKGEVKQIVKETPDGEFWERDDYYRELHNQPGFTTTYIYRPRETHKINTPYYTDYLNEARINIRDESKNKIGTRKASKHSQATLARINSRSRNIKVSANGKPLTYDRIYTDDEQHGGRFYTPIQNLSKKDGTRDKILLKEGFSEEIDIKSAKFHVLAQITDSIIPDEPYIQLGLDMGHSIEWSKANRDALKAMSQVMLSCQNMSEKGIKSAIRQKATQHGLIIPKKEYDNPNPNSHYHEFTDRDYLIENINNNTLPQYVALYKEHLPSIIKEGFENKNRVMSGKIRKFRTQVMNKEDFYTDENGNTFIMNYEDDKPYSVTVFTDKGLSYEMSKEEITVKVLLKEITKCAWSIFFKRNKTVKWEEFNVNSFFNAFINRYQKIYQLVLTDKVDYLLLESQLTEYILDKTLNQDRIDIINIHDAFVCKQNDKEKVEEIIRDMYYSKIMEILIKYNKHNKNWEKLLKEREEKYSYREQCVTIVEGLWVDEWGEIMNDLPPDTLILLDLCGVN